MCKLELLYFFSYQADADRLEHFNDYKLAWKEIIAQKTALVCFKEGSDEIVGLSFTFVISKSDNFEQLFFKQVRNFVNFIWFNPLTVYNIWN